MSLNKKITGAILSAGLGLAALVGYAGNSSNAQSKQLNNPRYFASIKTSYVAFNPVVMTATDVDGDGDQDLIVSIASQDIVYLYLLKNDGKGNYSQ